LQTMMERIQNPGTCRQELGIIGYGEGGLLALYAGAVDTRFLAVGVCGAFGLGQRNPELPLYRNVWSVLDRFGDAELAIMIMPRALIVEHGKYPEVTHSDKDGGAPGKLWRPTPQEFQAESERFSQLMQEMPAYFLTAGPDSVCDLGTAQLDRKLARPAPGRAEAQHATDCDRLAPRKCRAHEASIPPNTRRYPVAHARERIHPARVLEKGGLQELLRFYQQRSTVPRLFLGRDHRTFSQSIPPAESAEPISLRDQRLSRLRSRAGRAS
jgi:hypothetical protein